LHVFHFCSPPDLVGDQVTVVVEGMSEVIVEGDTQLSSPPMSQEGFAELYKWLGSQRGSWIGIA